MSDVETITKPILLPLIRSGVRSVGQLTRDEQWAISIWATLRSIIFDALAPTTGDRYYSELDRFDLRTVITPPPNTHVWLAPFSGTLHNARFVVVNKVEVSEDYGFHVMTAVINQIAFQIRYLERPRPQAQPARHAAGRLGHGYEAGVAATQARRWMAATGVP